MSRVPDPLIRRYAADIVRSIVQESPDTFFVKDEQLRMVLCSDGLARSIDKSAEDLYGKRDIEAGWDRDFVAGNAEKGIRGWEQDDRTALAGTPVRVQDEPRAAREGVLVGDVVKIPLKNENGDVIGIVGIGRDMTAREAARQEMVSIVSSSDDAIISKSLDGTIRSWNPAAERIYGYTAREAVGRNVAFMIPDDRKEDLPFFIRQVADGRHVNHFETERIRADGTRIFVSISISPIRDAAGRVTGACTIARDISERRRAETLLRESEARYRSLVENANDIIFELGLDGVVTYASPNWTSQLGHGIQDVVGRPLDEFVHPEDRGTARAFFSRTSEPGGRTNAEYRIRHRNGTWRWHSTSWSPILSNAGIVSFMGVARDVTETKKLEVLTSRYELILKHARDALLLIRPDGRITEANDAALGLYGYERGEMLGMNVTSLRPFDGAGRIGGELEEARRPGILFETVHARKDGRAVPVEISSQGVSVGGEEFVLAIVRDISARKRTEERLRESESRWRTIVSTSPDGILVLSRDGTIQQASSKVLTLCGYQAEAEVVGLSVFQLIHPSHRDKARAMLEMKASGVRTTTSDYLAMRRDGQVFPVEVNAELLPADGGAMSVVLVVRDVTEHKRLEEQFRQAQKMEAVGRLAGGVAHDFNNMLGVILGHAELAADQVRATDPVGQSLQEIQKAAQRSADLTRKLLAFARKQAVVPQVLDVNQTVRSMMKMLQRLIGEDIDLVLDLSPELWPVKVDPSQVDQVLANLAVNARDAITGPGRLVIATENVGPGGAGRSPGDDLPRGEFVLLSVSDSGIGMDEETLGHLFEPFFTTKEPGKGTGLGLATVYGAVKQNGGFIRVSTARGKGTTFRIYLPRVADQSAAMANPPAASPRGTGTILLVEDEESLLGLGRAVLQGNGYTVLTARSSIEALQVAEKHRGRIDLMITDLVLPGLNGKQLSEMLAESRPETKTLFISGYTAEVISHDGVVEEGIEYLQKPFSVHVLSERVRAALAERSD